MSLIYGDSATVCKQWKDLIFSKLAIHVVHSSFLFTVVTHQHTSEQLNFAFPSLPGRTAFLTQSFIATAQPVSPAGQDPLCALQHAEFQFPAHICICFALLFLLLHKLMDWMIAPQWLTHLGAQHLDLFPFSACSQETSYIVSGKLHFPPSTLRLEIIQKLLSPRGGTSIIALPPNLGFHLVLFPHVWVSWMSTELLLLMARFLTTRFGDP